MLGQHQDGKDASVTEIAQQLVHLKNQKTLVRHRVEIAIEAVNYHYPRVSTFYAAPHCVGKLARRHFSRGDLLESDQAAVEPILKWKAQRLRTCTHGAAPFVEGKDHRAL